MLLVGLAGAPFLWAGVPPAVVHNGLLIAALASSAWAIGRARPSADRRPVRRRPRRRHRRLRAVSLRAHRPPGAAVADVDAAGAARAARASSSGRARRPVWRSAPASPASCCAASTTACSSRSSPASPGSRWSWRSGLKPRLALSHRARGHPARAGRRALPRALRRQPRRARPALGHRDRPLQRASRPTTWRVPAFNALRGGDGPDRRARALPGRGGDRPRRVRARRPRAAACGGSMPPWRRSPSTPRSACTASRSACCRPRCRRSATCARRHASPASPWSRWPRWRRWARPASRARFASRGGWPAILGLAVAAVRGGVLVAAAAARRHAQADDGRPLAGDAARGHRDPRAAGAAAGPACGLRDLAPGPLDPPLAPARERLQRVHAAGLRATRWRYGDVPRRQLDRAPAPAVGRLCRRPPAELPTTTA